MRLWVDDLREPPAGWYWAKNSATAIGVLGDPQVDVAVISLDHDLGDQDTTRPVVLWMAERRAWPATVQVHTANPVGRDWLVGMVERYGPGVSQ